MPQNTPELTTYLLVLLISVISGTISIINRLIKGHAGGILWIVSEFLAAILCGYLAYDSYAQASVYLPDWVTMPIFVAASAHTSGRLLQAAGSLITNFASGVKPTGGK